MDPKLATATAGGSSEPQQREELNQPAMEPGDTAVGGDSEARVVRRSDSGVFEVTCYYID